MSSPIPTSSVMASGESSEAVSDRSVQDAPPEPATPTCNNCGATLRGEFCHACGQRDRGGSITFRELAVHLVDTVFNVRRGFLYTLGQVLIRPGDVARRYVEGQRKQFVNPLTLFLVAATAMFLAYGLIEDEFMAYLVGVSELTTSDEMFESGSLETVFGISSREEYAEWIYAFISRVYSYLGIAYCLLAGLAHRMFFAHRTVAENLVFELFVISQSNLLVVGVFVLATSVGMPAPAILGLTSLVLILVHAPAGIAYFEEGWKGGVLAPLGFLAGYLASFALVAVLSFVGGFVYAILAL